MLRSGRENETIANRSKAQSETKTDHPLFPARSVTPPTNPEEVPKEDKVNVEELVALERKFIEQQVQLRREYEQRVDELKRKFEEDIDERMVRR